MKRVALFAALVAVVRRSRGRCGRRGATGVPDEAHGLGRLERRPRAQRLQEGGGRVRQGAPRRHARTSSAAITDTKIVAAIRSGQAPDVVSSFNSYNVGIYCGTGGWIDLAPLMKKSHIKRVDVPGGDAVLHPVRAASGARCRCSPTPTASTTTRRSSRRPGSRSPPKTIAELDRRREEADGPRTRTDRSRSSASTRSIGFYENVPGALGHRVRRQVARTAKGNSILAKPPGWAKWLKWQKSLIDWYGYNNLVKFQAGLGDEFSASNAFEIGKLAMNCDGEWRVAFIQAEHPKLNYGTAPLPVDDAHPELYGSGYINGTIIGIPKNGEHTRPGVGSRQVPDDEHARARRAVERPPQRAVDLGLDSLEGADARRALRDVPEDLREPEVGNVADHGVGRCRTRTLVQQLRDEVAGREGQEPRRRRSRQLDKQLDAQVEAGQGRRRSAVSSSDGRGGSAGAPAGQEAGGVAAPAPRAPAHEPLARRLLRLLRLPARDERVPVVQPLRPALAAALGRASRTTATCSPTTRRSDGGEEHALADRGARCRCRCCSRSASR